MDTSNAEDPHLQKIGRRYIGFTDYKVFQTSSDSPRTQRIKEMAGIILYYQEGT